jgi:hypothetical protein
LLWLTVCLLIKLYRLSTNTVPAIKFEVIFAHITFLCTATLNFPWESVFCYLRVPFLNSGKRAKTFVAFTGIFTWFICISLQYAAPVIVNIVLPAVPSMVLIWGSWIKWSSRQSFFWVFLLTGHDSQMALPVKLLSSNWIKWPTTAIRTRDCSRRAAVDLSLKRRGYWDRRSNRINVIYSLYIYILVYIYIYIHIYKYTYMYRKKLRTDWS